MSARFSCNIERLAGRYRDSAISTSSFDMRRLRTMHSVQHAAAISFESFTLPPRRALAHDTDDGQRYTPRREIAQVASCLHRATRYSHWSSLKS